MASDGGMAFWAFVHYIENNPNKAAGGMTNDDIEDMALLFYASNLSIINQTRPAVGAAFTNADYPDKDGGDGTGIAAVRDSATIDQAYFPETHRAS